MPRFFRASKSRFEAERLGATSHARNEAGPSRWRNPFSFAITPAGGCYILSVFLIALAAVRTGNNLIYLILALWLSFAIVSGIAARLSLRALLVSLQVPQNVFEGENVSVKISLQNRKRWIASFSILVEDLSFLRARRRAWRRKILKPWSPTVPVDTDDRSRILHYPAYFPAIPARASRAVLISQSFPRRGKYRLEGMRLSTRFPFGFFRRGERISVSGEVLVYPSIWEISSDFHLLPFLPGKLEGKRAGQGESLYAIRNYREGESARLIHWKATAKTGRVMSREHARDEESEFCLILETMLRTPGSESAAQFEKAVSMAASLAAHFAREGAEFEYLTPHEYIPRGTGVDHLYRVLQSLAVVACEPALSGTLPAMDQVWAPVLEKDPLARILSAKVFKIFLTSRPRGTMPASIWHSSYVIYFDEL